MGLTTTYAVGIKAQMMRTNSVQHTRKEEKNFFKFFTDNDSQELTSWRSQDTSTLQHLQATSF